MSEQSNVAEIIQSLKDKVAMVTREAMELLSPRDAEMTVRQFGAVADNILDGLTPKPVPAQDRTF